MRAVRRLVAYRLAVGWPGWVALVLLVGLAGGAVLAAVAGARRTASAYPRFLVASRASDVLVGPASWDSVATTTRWAACPAWRRPRRLSGCRHSRSDRAGS